MNAARKACSSARYGVLFRDLLAREANAPKWRDLAPILRQLEARGEIRGGRFVSGPFGEQFALPEAVDALRAARRDAEARTAEDPMTLAAADPLNLIGILVPGERTAAIPGRTITLQNGVPPPSTHAEIVPPPTKPNPRRSRTVLDILRDQQPPTRRPGVAGSLGLFS